MEINLYFEGIWRIVPNADMINLRNDYFAFLCFSLSWDLSTDLWVRVSNDLYKLVYDFHQIKTQGHTCLEQKN